MSSSQQILRVSTRAGMLRVSVEPSSKLAVARAAAAEKLGVEARFITLATQPRNGKPLDDYDASLKELGLGHGALIYASESTSATTTTTTTTTSAATAATATTTAAAATSENQPSDTPSINRALIKQDAVDDELEKDAGKIPRSRDPSMCHHPLRSMCSHCMPVDPYDGEYLKQKGIKHMSFHAYLRKITADNKNASSSSNDNKGGWNMPSFHQPPPLDEPFFGVKIPCPGGRHAPWPASICTLCQPSAVALNMQPFRHVDHVQFASHGIVNDFIEFWRASGTQRFGFMYGRYERHPEVPLGIKAVVEVIYEPRQHNMQDGLSVDFDHWWSTESKIADDIASKCGLQRVGCIFTDLEDDSTGRGTVLVKRHKDAFFMSSVETCFAADLQKRHASACKWSSTGQHGSKFVTCIITGNDKGGIDISAYQVSDATVALRDADLIVASTDPSMMLVAEETDGKYVQEIIYRYVNEYNTPVSSTAKPAFPVEYLLVNLTSGTPEKEDALFKSSAMFSIENRQSLMGATQQGYAELHQHLEKAIKNNAQDGGYVKALSDFHLLVYLKTTDMFSDDELSLLTRIAIGQETASTANRLLEGCSGWQTLLTVLQSMDTTQTTSSGSGSSSTNRQQNSTWSCQHCTMINEGGDDDCSMCGLPRNS